jgi:hypothetical protein
VRLQSQDRNRLFATVSGVAAAVLIAVGFVTGIGKPGTKTPPKSATQTTNPNPGKHKHVTTPPSPVTPGIANPGGGAALASAPGGSSVRTNATVVDVISPSTTVGPTGGKTPPPTPPTGPTGTAPTGASGSLLTPVVNLVGHLVTTVGTTVNTAGTGLSGTLPLLTPVTTGVVGGLGNVLTGLGDSLIT